MVQDDPSKRPSIDEVVEHFGALQGSLSAKQLRSRVVYVPESISVREKRDARHFFTNTVWDILFSRNPLPSPSSEV